LVLLACLSLQSFSILEFPGNATNNKGHKRRGAAMEGNEITYDMIEEYISVFPPEVQEIL
jgi:hypothetical protein